MIKMSDDKEYCCEGNAYLQSAFDKLLFLHERTMFDGEDLETPITYDNECELWTLRDLIKRCPWCHQELMQSTNKEDKQ